MRGLARICYQLSTVEPRSRTSTVLRLKNGLNVRSNRPPRVCPRARSIHTLSRPLATEFGEKSGLGIYANPHQIRLEPLIGFLVVVLILSLCVSCSTTPRLGSKRYPIINPSTKYYQVKKGDTLFAISWRASLDYRSVARWNGISKPYTIHVGQKLKLFKPNQWANESRWRARDSKKTSRKEKKYTKKPNIPKSKKKLLKVLWQWPLKGVIRKTFNQTGGKGLDIGGARGQSVFAAAGGKVVYSGSGLIRYGKLIIVKHNERFLSAYGNNRVLLAKEGESVRRGQKIAELDGKRGKTPVLHFEVRSYGKSVNPLNYLPKR